MGAEVKSKCWFNGSARSRVRAILASRMVEKDADERVAATRHAGSRLARSSHDFAYLRLHATRVELRRGGTVASFYGVHEKRYIVLIFMTSVGT